MVKRTVLKSMNYFKVQICRENSVKQFSYRFKRITGIYLTSLWFAISDYFLIFSNSLRAYFYVSY